MADINMPMDIVSDEVDIKEVIEGRGEMFGVIEVPEVTLKSHLIDLYGTEALTEMCFPPWDKRSSGPGLKSSKCVL